MRKSETTLKLMKSYFFVVLLLCGCGGSSYSSYTTSSSQPSLCPSSASYTSFVKEGHTKMVQTCIIEAFQYVKFPEATEPYDFSFIYKQ